MTSTGIERFPLTRNQHPHARQRREEILADPGFGTHFTDHMVRAVWTKGEGWHDQSVVPYGPVTLDPAAAVLHYAQEAFEGLKGFRHADGSIWGFRPEANAARLARSCRRLALPELSEEEFLGAIEALVAVDGDWVPEGTGEKSLYLRPFMFASEPFLGVRPAHEVTFLLIASPAGSYFSGGVTPLTLWLSQEYTRAAPGGTGAAKCGGNYAASLAAQSEGIEHGCDQVVFLDATTRRQIEELGGMNLFFIRSDGTALTPPTSGTILEGVTRSSIIHLLRDRGYTVTEEPVDIDVWREGARDGSLSEVFACGTAAVITPVGKLVDPDGEYVTANHEVTLSLRQELVDIQYGRSEDTYGWLRRFG